VCGLWHVACWPTAREFGWDIRLPNSATGLVAELPVHLLRTTSHEIRAAVHVPPATCHEPRSASGLSACACRPTAREFGCRPMRAGRQLVSSAGRAVAELRDRVGCQTPRRVCCRTLGCRLVRSGRQERRCVACGTWLVGRQLGSLAVGLCVSADS